MHEFEECLKHSLDHLEDSEVKKAMLYSLCAPGKRLRPRMIYAVLDAYGINRELGDGCALAIEMIHTYSLIHDDLPCMDDDDLRRGRKTCHKEFDEATALLAGDALLSEAFRYVATSTKDSTINNQLVLEFVNNIGANGMILGQMIDLESENQQVTIDVCEKIDLLKTGCLFALALVSGCLIANKKNDIEIWRKIGFKLGLAFQIQDDCLDVTTSEEILGKSISDEKNQKSTFVSELGYDKSKELYERYFNEIEDDLKKCNIHLKPVLNIFSEIRKRDH